MRALCVAAAMGLLACQQQVSTQPEGTAAVAATRGLAVHMLGRGTVTAPQFTCSGDCAQTLPQGTALLLTAAADAGYRFDGWQGDCTGSGTCAVTLDNDRVVSASFSPLQPPPPGQVRVTVVTNGTGSGSVVSQPAGIDCPGSCSMVVTTGALIVLKASPDAKSKFAGYTGACTGDTCAFNANAAETVWADFEALPPPPPPPPPQCDGITPGATPPFTLASVSGASCEPGLGTQNGALGLETRTASGGWVMSFFDEATGQKRGDTGGTYATGVSGGFTQQPGEFTAVTQSNSYALQLWNAQGALVQSSQPIAASNVAWHPMETDGVLLGGDFNGRHQLWLFHSSAQLAWSVDLAAAGPVFGLGSDTYGNILVITGDIPNGRITGQWFDSSGTAQTQEIVLLASFTAGKSTWFETAPLIGGGVAVRRVDQLTDANGRPYRTSQWLLVAQPWGEVTPAPAWLTSRPNTNLKVARAGQAYAMLPLGQPDADCAQKLEVLAYDGTSCGSFDASVSTGRCRTEDLSLTRDDTPVQLVPAGFYPAGTCTWRFWPNALR